MEGVKGLCAFLILTQVLYLIEAFNIDTYVPIVKNGNPNSYFGFSVAQHLVYRHQTNKHDPVIIVGAPRDNVTDRSAPSQVRDVVSPGVVYYCPFSSFTDDCKDVKINREVPRAGEVQDNQWLGVSVSSQGNQEGKAVACAHRFRFTGPGYDQGPGICIILSNELDEDDFLEPCSGKPKTAGHGQYGLCQAGTSLDISKDGEVLIGTPGPYNWRGTAFKYTVVNSLTDAADWYQSPVEDPLDDLEKPEPATGYYSYLGMSSKIGQVLDGQKTYVVGAPRSKNVGEVLLFKQETVMLSTGPDHRLSAEPQHRLAGEQFGSGFGYDTAIGDFNGDGEDDIVVGAPFFHKAGRGGVIYVYINEKNEGITDKTVPLKIESRKMKETDCKMLDCTNARFGFSLASIGDINQDGYGDLAVGAPFEGSGAVYIFHGSINGINPEYSQRIYASELQTARPLETFGYSLVGGMDMDQNGYNDLVVGAYESSKVLIMRTRPVVHINATMFSEPKEIDQNQGDRCKNGRGRLCFDLRVCFKFRANPVKRFPDGLLLNYTIKTEMFNGRQKSRVSLKASPNTQVLEKTIMMSPQQDNRYACERITVYIEKNNRDFYTPLFFELTYNLADDRKPSMQIGGQVPDINHFPVANQQASRLEVPVRFKTNCIEECDSDLAVYGKMDLEKDEGYPVIKVGENKEVRLEVTVENRGEDAHEATLTILLPKSLPFLNSQPKIGCVYQVLEDEDTNMVLCPIGNPLVKILPKIIIFRLNARQITAREKIISIGLKVNTTSAEMDLDNNESDLKVKVVVDTDMAITGESYPSGVFYGGEVLGESAIKYEDQIGPNIVHSYTVTNKGSGRVQNSTVVIFWPYQVENGYPIGKHLLYLMEEPQIDEPGRCVFPNGIVNPLGIKSNGGKDFDVLPVVSGDEKTGPGYKNTNERSKRETRRVSGRDKRIAYMDCTSGSAKCHKIICYLGSMEAKESIVINLRARLWNHTFTEDYRKVDQVRVMSSGRIVIDPKLNVHQDNTNNDAAFAMTVARPDTLIKEPGDLPLWIIILAIIGGLILLIILIVLLWKCGFFKRKRPEDMHKVEKKKNYYEEDYN